MMFATDLEEFKVPPNWIYRGEGNCNVVISLPTDKKILRIRKIEKSSSILSWILNWISDIIQWYYGSGSYEELRDISFYKDIIRPLIGSNFVCDAEQVFLSRKQINILEQELAHQRPDHRKIKKLQYGRAALFDDYTFLPDDFYPFLLSDDTFAIEIKPKQGWISFGEKLSLKCTFCMNQYIKQEKGQIKAITSYCPLDLFSGEQATMLKAIKALIHNPQNNLKVFKNGHYVYGEDCDIEEFESVIVSLFNTDNQEYGSLLFEFSLLLQKCLLTNFETIQKADNCNLKLFCQWNKIIQESSTHNLPKGCVLEKILSAQMLDTEGAQYYYKLLGNKKFRNYGYVKKLLKELKTKQGTCLKCAIMMLGNDENVDDNDLKLVPYLISTIAKDCSLMVTFKKIMESTRDVFNMKNIISTKYGDFLVNVGVFDLYPKPVSTIIKHRKKIKKLIDIAQKRKSL